MGATATIVVGQVVNLQADCQSAFSPRLRLSIDVLQSFDPMASPGTAAPAARTSLLPVLGLFFGIAVTIGATLGVGILRQPGPVASYLRAPWLIMLMWFVGAI